MIIKVIRPQVGIMTKEMKTENCINKLISLRGYNNTTF